MGSEMDSDHAICKPIKSLSELGDIIKNPPHWSSLIIPKTTRSKVVRNSDLYFNGSICHTTTLDIVPPSRYEYGFLPKTLVCHDMMNGYKDDSHIAGTDNFSAYTFYNWAVVDIFVYFSHHFITIPPLGWINAAHKHGVQILGTLITEWDDGFKLCQEFLKSEDTMQAFVRNLVVVTKLFKFDGWLLNIENNIEKSKVDMLLKFVKYFSDLIHSEVPGSLVIWYDSVTKDGELKWQDSLNTHNFDFFNACDGIFTNYCWTENELQRSLEMAKQRRNDVYVGVDVWGRNFWGGGCLNTAEAIKVIHKYGLSMAIFAPAWTHEAIHFRELMEQQYLLEKYERDYSCAAKIETELGEQASKSFRSNFFTKCAVKDYFILRETAFWNSIWPYLNTRGPSQLPFQTFFCLGSGNKKIMDGEIINEELWFNLNEQEYQISIPFCSNSYILEKINTKTDDKEAGVMSQRLKKDDIIMPKRKKPPVVKYNVKPNVHLEKCVLPHTKESYKGGNCLKLVPVTYVSGEIKKNHIVRLFLCEFLCDHNFIIYYIFKTDDPEQDLSLRLSLRDNKSGVMSQIVLCGGANNDKYLSGGLTVLNPLREVNHDKFKKLQMDLLSSHSQFYIPVNNDKKWQIRYFALEHPNSTILDINCSLTNIKGFVLLGGLGITRDVPI